MTLSTLKNEPLKAWCNAFEAAQKRVHALTRRWSREQFNFQPAPDQWSVGQCIEHLNVSMRIYLDVMEPVIEVADRRTDAPYDRGPFMGRVLLCALRTPGMRYPAPARFRPGSGNLDPDSVCEDFDQQAIRMQQAIKRCDGLTLSNIEMPWPVLRLVKISLEQAFELLILHTDRHLKQAERLTQVNAFPA